MPRFSPSLVRGAVLLGCFTLLAVSAGCTHVKPYEREYLTRPGMDTKHSALSEEFEAHVYDAREGANGARSSTGGGCGCN